MTEFDAFVELNNPTIASLARRHVAFDAGRVRTAVICDLDRINRMVDLGTLYPMRSDVSERN